MNLEIENTLVLSTAHMPASLAADMDTGDEVGMAYYPLDDDGYLVLVLSDPTEYPEPVQQAVKLAYDNGCKWIRFDKDAEVVEGLPTWEW